MQHIFLIGPGGVGKSSTGKILAERLSRNFIDLDQQFCERIAPIRQFLDANDYPAYLRRNSLLLRDELHQAAQPSVFALSSGFLVTDAEPEVQLVNHELIRKSGISVLLMPSRNFAESLEIVVDRQLRRGLCLERASQIATFTARFQPYMEMGEIKIFSKLRPEELANEIVQRLIFHHASALHVSS